MNTLLKLPPQSQFTGDAKHRMKSFSDFQILSRFEIEFLRALLQTGLGLGNSHTLNLA